MDWHGVALSVLGERLGSGDGEEWTLLTRQIAFEPLPASVLFGLHCGGFYLIKAWNRLNRFRYPKNANVPVGFSQLVPLGLIKLDVASVADLMLSVWEVNHAGDFVQEESSSPGLPDRAGWLVDLNGKLHLQSVASSNSNL
jgi:hypothetical protein